MTLDARLAKSFGSFALDVELHSETGLTTVLLGESGSGKSMVLKLLAGLLAPDEGRFALDGRTYVDTARRVFVPPQARPIGYVFQDYVLFPHLSVFDNVAFGLRMQRLPGAAIRARVAAALAQVHLVGYDDRRPSQLSGGQQQRVAIARALALRPDLLLLDESLSALDIQTRREVREELRQVLAGFDLTAVMVTHQYSDALLFADRIVVLDGGRVIQTGRHVDLLTAPRSSYVAQLVGVNHMRGTVVDGRDGEVGVELAGDEPLTLRATVPAAPRPARGQGVAVIVHPRAIRLHEREAPGLNVIRGEVTGVIPISATARPGARDALDGLIQVDLSIGPGRPLLRADVTVTSSAALGLAPGRVVHAAFAAADTIAVP